MIDALIVIRLLCGLRESAPTNALRERKYECVNFYANCLIGDNGKYLTDKRQKCELTYKGSL